jgi:methyl-accepting chemotaxis protein
VTQQNAALVEESAAAAESLRQQAMGLNAVVQRFSMAAVPG